MMWQKASENIPHLDGRPVLWLNPDGMGATVCMYVDGYWWEVWEEDGSRWRSPEAAFDDFKDQYWADLPADRMVEAIRRSADQYHYLKFERDKNDTEPNPSA